MEECFFGDEEGEVKGEESCNYPQPQLRYEKSPSKVSLSKDILEEHALSSSRQQS